MDGGVTPYDPLSAKLARTVCFIVLGQAFGLFFSHLIGSFAAPSLCSGICDYRSQQKACQGGIVRKNHCGVLLNEPRLVDLPHPAQKAGIALGTARDPGIAPGPLFSLSFEYFQCLR